MIRRAGAKLPLPPPIRRADVRTGELRSYWQELVIAWEAEREPSTTWTAAMAVHLVGRLEVGVLEASVHQLLERQDALLQVFHADGSPGICRPADVPFTISEAPSDEAYEHLSHERANGKFLLNGSPLIRFDLFRRGAESHSLIVTWHHLVHDAARGGVLAAEILEAYTARVERRTHEQPPLPLRFVDYVAWERAWFEGEGRAAVDAARQSLAHVKPLPLPHDRPRPARLSPACISSQREIDGEAAARIAARFRDHGDSAQLVTAVSCTLSAWCGADDVVLVWIATRIPPEMRGVAGRFGVVGALCVHTGPEASLRELLVSTRQSINAFAEAAVPAVLVYETSKVIDHPLSQVALNLATYPGYAKLPQPPGVTAVADILPHTRTARRDLEIVVRRMSSGIRTMVLGATDVFDQPTIDGVNDGLIRMLTASHPYETRLSDVRPTLFPR